LAKEGLHCDLDIEIIHLLTALRKKVGLDRIKKSITRPYQDLRIATHYGCHALRPSDIVGFDDPVTPTIFDDLVTITGAQSIDWTEKLACCGAPLHDVNKTLSVDLTQKKMASAKQSAAHYLTTACPFCQIQFETVSGEGPPDTQVPSIVYPQLLGLAMGLDEHALGMNPVNMGRIEGHLAA
jgi:heterodisulfide reductase subunit B